MGEPWQYSYEKPIRAESLKRSHTHSTGVWASSSVLQGPALGWRCLHGVKRSLEIDRETRNLREAACSH